MMLKKKIFLKNKKESNKDSGTAIVWSNCDRLDIARGETLYRRMSKNFAEFLDIT